MGGSQNCAPYIGSGRGWLAGDWPPTGGVLNITAVPRLAHLRIFILRYTNVLIIIIIITAAAWTAGFQWWRSGDITRTQNVSEYMLVLALCLVYLFKHQQQRAQVTCRENQLQ